MSRRTKLLITALFLVLLGIPALYVILTWAPANPLRVRMDPTLPMESSDEEGFNILTAHVLVENDGATPIHLLRLDYVPSFPSLPPPRIFPDPVHPSGPASTFHWGTEIPAHGTVSMEVTVPVQYVGAVHTGNFTAEYSYISQTKGWFLKACLWVDDHLPEFLRHRLPPCGSQKGIITIAVLEDDAPPPTPTGALRSP